MDPSRGSEFCPLNLRVSLDLPLGGELGLLGGVPLEEDAPAAADIFSLLKFKNIKINNKKLFFNNTLFYNRLNIGFNKYKMH